MPHVTLTASDGHKLDAYLAKPDNPIGAVVIIQEIFGVNSHIRSVVDDYAREGFFAIAPAIFDRAQREVEFPDDRERAQKGMGMVQQIGFDNMLKDIAAAIDYAKQETGRRVGVVGYCLGGSLAWAVATRLNPDAAVCYYGGRIAENAKEQPQCPVMMHFGSHDPSIGPEKIDPIRKAHPDIPIYMYDAGHGFNCDQRKDYDAASSALAKQRTLEFLKKNLAQ